MVELIVELIRTPFLGCEYRGILVCMSIYKSPHDIVVASGEGKMQSLRGEGGGYLQGGLSAVSLKN